MNKRLFVYHDQTGRWSERELDMSNRELNCYRDYKFVVDLEDYEKLLKDYENLLKSYENLKKQFDRKG